MFFHDRQLQREVKVDTPDPGFAKALQQAIGGIEGEIRVALQNEQIGSGDGGSGGVVDKAKDALS